MKIVTITYSNAQNYGALLQAYALSSYIKELGLNCKLLNYRKFDNRLFKPRKNFKDIFFSIIKFPENFKRIKRYKYFRDNFLPLTDLIEKDNELPALNSVFDVFITGSDQVWSCLGEVNPAFYLEFVAKENKSIAYAPSFGVPRIPSDKLNKVILNLNNIDCVSVRERSGAELIKALINKDVPVVVDPVFLINIESWRNLAAKIPESEPYIFAYSTQNSMNFNRAVKEISQKQGVKIISTHAIPGCNCIVKKDIGPLEFLGYILNANHIISTSFHATAFSIIFSKNFCVVPHSQTGARVVDLLHEANLEQALWSECGYEYPELDYSNSGMATLKEKVFISEKFLKNSLGVLE